MCPSTNRTEKGAGYLDNNEDSSSNLTDYGQAENLYINPDPHDTDLVREAYVKHAEDDDFGQAGTLYRDVFDDAEKERFVHNITNKMMAIKNQDVEEQSPLSLQQTQRAFLTCGLRRCRGPDGRSRRQSRPGRRLPGRCTRRCHQPGGRSG
ncbi:hypothetical protein IAU68_00155 [Corynebacterium lujinxingii]|uniref:Catalase immune-responsive domain-containing protein n=1 Tax=Corynebacterium lujinxingii TaxID=2763010 RepID=A0A7H0JYZ0_9CORY|nr:hypothetical protein [Corynebacterium lujinxingii]NNO10113.1 hypothetical protein [Corynebacterium lujinxingii]QNP90256.1 hypothetical protein IAU68_00155 [Corynebacterium lujinxingii]